MSNAELLQFTHPLSPDRDYEIEPASRGRLVLQRDLECSSTTEDIYPSLEDLLGSTAPIEISSEMLIIRGIASRSFMHKKREPKAKPIFRVHENENGFKLRTLEGYKPNGYRIKRTTHSREYAVVAFGMQDLYTALGETEGFMFPNERYCLAAALMRRVVLPETHASSQRGVTNDGRLSLKPRGRAFRVDVRNWQNNGMPYRKPTASRGPRIMDITWNWRYEMED